jgi:plasmid replication initiation protein
MGIDSGRYADFNALNYHVVKKAVAEVNKKTDLIVKAKYQTDKRKIAEIRFAVLSKTGFVKARLDNFVRVLEGAGRAT